MSQFEVGDEISLDAPSQPPHRAIVVDRLGTGWQRTGKKWCRTGHVISIMGNADGLKWAELLLTYGPVSVVHLPAPADEEVA